ncbi:hypothetical protein CANMA_005219 [Candida margitis]|uniref:uncharacterized protein n=1 Tax=Candida margitis TaxID=1775924 RepID=UPI0022265202|nr:uncharacterized protein CANMA_005219 [Candida margitis]KAI5950559.1 hypothetical protein CANMA_005219 [Candida margitis]
MTTRGIQPKGSQTLPLYLTKEHKAYLTERPDLLTISPKKQARISPTNKSTPLNYKLNESRSPLPIFNPPSSTSSSTVDNITPEAKTRFSPEIDRSSEDLIRRVEEIIQTETTYISHCSNLVIQYLTNLQHFQTELPAAVHITKECVFALVDIHNQLLKEMISIRNQNQSIVDMCNSIAQSIAKSGISVFWYSLYCTHYDQLIPFELFVGISNKSLNQENGTPSMKSFFLGIKNFLESQQVTIKRKDLSFMSLCQRPVDRIVKYKLFVKGMMNTFVELGADTTILVKAFELISQQLAKIDESRIYMNENRQLNSLVDFAGPQTNPLYQRLNLEANFFGNPVAIGFASVISLKNSKPEMIHSPIILYKAHLVILEYNPVITRHSSKKYKPKFIIPLSNISIFKEFKNGLLVNLTTAIKLQFRASSNQYQMVLCFLSSTEYEFWKIKLDLLINVTHQGSSDYKSEVSHLFYFIPKNITACWKDQYNESEKYLNHVDSQQTFRVKFRVDLCLKNKVCLKVQELPPGPKYTLKTWIIDVFNNERHFKHIASKEIPFHTCNRTETTDG